VRSLALQLGDSLPLWAGAAPIAILAFLPKSERDRLIGELERSPGAASPSRLDLQDTIAQTRERGYAVSDKDVILGIAAVGAPVYNHRGELEAAISISGLRPHLLGDLAATAQIVVAAATDTSAALGYSAEVAGR
jgi:DNA-binding IclR family transcriptional regulator